MIDVDLEDMVRWFFDNIDVRWLTCVGFLIIVGFLKIVYVRCFFMMNITIIKNQRKELLKKSFMNT